MSRCSTVYDYDEPHERVMALRTRSIVESLTLHMQCARDEAMDNPDIVYAHEVDEFVARAVARWFLIMIREPEPAQRIVDRLTARRWVGLARDDLFDWLDAIEKELEGG